MIVKIKKREKTYIIKKVRKFKRSGKSIPENCEILDSKLGDYYFYPRSENIDVVVGALRQLNEEFDFYGVGINLKRIDVNNTPSVENINLDNIPSSLRSVSI